MSQKLIDVDLDTPPAHAPPVPHDDSSISNTATITTSSSSSTTANATGSCLFILSISRVELPPFIAFAVALKSLGFRVAVCAPEHLEPLIKGQYADVFEAFYAIQFPIDALYRTYAFKKAHFDGSLLDQVQVEATLQTHTETNWRKEFDAAKDWKANLLVCSESAIAESLCIGQRLNMPTFIAASRPCIPTSALAPVGVQAPAMFNKMLHSFASQYKAADISTKISRFRFKLGLHDTLSFDYQNIPQCLMLSELFLPRPADYGKNVLMTGFLTLPDELVARYTPSPQLTAFLAAPLPSASVDDARPFYIGVASMPAPDGFVSACLAAVAALGRRVVLCGAFTSDLTDKVPPHAIVLDDEPPLEWLLPRCRAAVLCGDPARVGAALTAGCTLVALPVTTTQRFVAARLVALGVPAAPPAVVNANASESSSTPATGDGVVLLKDATQATLQALLSALDQPARRTAAAALATQLRAEHAAVNASKFVEATFATQRHCGVGMSHDNGWLPDAKAEQCKTCGAAFGFLLRRHHCRSCGEIFCSDCLALDSIPSYNEQVMSCRMCFEARAALRETGIVHHTN